MRRTYLALIVYTHITLQRDEIYKFNTLLFEFTLKTLLETYNHGFGSVYNTVSFINVLNSPIQALHFVWFTVSLERFDLMRQNTELNLNRAKPVATNNCHFLKEMCGCATSYRSLLRCIVTSQEPNSCN